jgi:hypothetical protein
MPRSARLLILIAMGSPFLSAMVRTQGSEDRKPRGLAHAGRNILGNHASRLLQGERAIDASLGLHRSGRPVLPPFQAPPKVERGAEATLPPARAISRRPALDAPLFMLPCAALKKPEAPPVVAEPGGRRPTPPRSRQADTGLQSLATVPMTRKTSGTERKGPAPDREHPLGGLEDQESKALEPTDVPGLGKRLGRPRPPREETPIMAGSFLGFCLRPGPSVNLGQLPPGPGVPQIRVQLEPAPKGEPPTLIMQNPPDGKYLTLALPEAVRSRGIHSRVEPLIPPPGARDAERDLRTPFPLEPGQTYILNPGFVDATETFVLRDEGGGEYATLVLSSN